MPAFTRDQYTNAYSKAPGDIRATALSDETANALKNIEARYNISKNLFDVSAIVGYTLVGLIPVKKFIEALEKDAGLDEATAKSVAQDVRAQIFGPVAQSLAGLQEEAEQTWEAAIQAETEADAESSQLPDMPQSEPVVAPPDNEVAEADNAEPPPLAESEAAPPKPMQPIEEKSEPSPQEAVPQPSPETESIPQETTPQPSSETNSTPPEPAPAETASPEPSKTILDIKEDEEEVPPPPPAEPATPPPAPAEPEPPPPATPAQPATPAPPTNLPGSDRNNAPPELDEKLQDEIFPKPE